MPRPTQVPVLAITRCPYGGVTLCAAVFQTASGSCDGPRGPVLQPRSVLERTGLGSSLFARHYWGNRYFFLLLRVLRCFSSPGSPHLAMVVDLQSTGLPHSDTAGSIRVCQSPAFFAAYRVLPRLPKPRHPPFALASLSLCESFL